MTVAAATERAGPRISGKQCRKECSQGFIIRRVRADACFIIYKSRAVGRSTRGRRVRHEAKFRFIVAFNDTFNFITRRSSRARASRACPSREINR